MRTKALYERHREGRLQYGREYYLANKESILAKRKAYRKENRERIVEYNRKYYGAKVPPENIRILYEKQNGLCAICSKAFTSSRDTHVDHCHTTGKIHGLLCNNCNVGIGFFGDDPERLLKARDYLINTDGSFPG